MSKILELKIEDVCNLDHIQKKLEIKSVIKTSYFYLKLNNYLKSVILIHISDFLEGDEEWLFPNEDEFYLFERDEFFNDCHRFDYNEHGQKSKLILKNAPDLQRKLILLNNNKPITQPSLNREIKVGLKKMGFKHWDKITPQTTQIIWGRRIIEIKGDDYETLKRLRSHFNFRTEKQLMNFLQLHPQDKQHIVEFRGKEETVFEKILYDFELLVV